MSPALLQSFTDGTVVLGNLPPMSDHGPHYIAIGPDQKVNAVHGVLFAGGLGPCTGHALNTFAIEVIQEGCRTRAKLSTQDCCSATVPCLLTGRQLFLWPAQQHHCRAHSLSDSLPAQGIRQSCDMSHRAVTAALPLLQLYFNLGTPFNIGIPGPSGIILANGTNVTFGKILRMNLDGSDLEVWVEGGHNLPLLVGHGHGGQRQLAPLWGKVSSSWHCLLLTEIILEALNQIWWLNPVDQLWSPLHCGTTG